MSTGCLVLRGTDYESVAILGRFLLAAWGLFITYPALEMANRETELADAMAKMLLWSSLYFVVAGVFGCWSFFGAGVVTLQMAVWVSLPDGIHLILLQALMPVVLVLSSICAILEWCGYLRIQKYLGPTTTEHNKEIISDATKELEAPHSLVEDEQEADNDTLSSFDGHDAVLY